MRIALDYDDTFTRDPHRWLEFSNMMRAAGHIVYGVTMRYPGEADGMSPFYTHACDAIFFTGRKAKLAFMNDLDIVINVWIDDSPIFILQDAR